MWVDSRRPTDELTAGDSTLLFRTARRPRTHADRRHNGNVAHVGNYNNIDDDDDDDRVSDDNNDNDRDGDQTDKNRRPCNDYIWSSQHDRHLIGVFFCAATTTTMNWMS